MADDFAKWLRRRYPHVAETIFDATHPVDM